MRGLGGEFPLIPADPSENIQAGGAGQPLEEQQDESASQSVAEKFFVIVAHSTGFRRLHLVDACLVKHQGCRQVYFLNATNPDAFDAICLECKRRMRAEAGTSEKEACGSSSSEATSSTAE